MKYLEHGFSLSFGCDPEVFLSKEVGKLRKRRSIVGSEVVVPKCGLKATALYPYTGSQGTVVQDGIQVELHPKPNTCRANLALALKCGFQVLARSVEKASASHSGLKVDFDQVVRVSKGDLLRVSPDARQLGCVPSKNIYGRRHIQKDGTKYLVRSAAGHIHLGTNILKMGATTEHQLVSLLDVLVGNTAVLLDRDPLAAERRKLYGRAGEYRLPKHGLEYRTLSNFWLKDYKLMSLMFGMAKLAHVVAGHKVASKKERHWLGRDKIKSWDAAHSLMGSIDLRRIEAAINENDFDLARQNYNEWVRPFLAKLSTIGNGIDNTCIKEFDFFVDMIRDHGLGYWFKDEPLLHWCRLPDGHNTGWESFVTGKVRRVMEQLGKAASIQGVVQIPDGPARRPVYDPYSSTDEGRGVEA